MPSDSGRSTSIWMATAKVPNFAQLTEDTQADICVVRAGIKVERVRRAPLDSFDTGPALRFSRQAQFHPTKYLAAIAKAIERDGGRICTGTHVDQITGGTPTHVTTNAGYIVTAGALVV